MADPILVQSKALDETLGGVQSRKEKRKALKKLKRKQIRKEAAIKDREEEEAISNDPEEQLRIRLKEQEEAEIAERARKEFEERERIWLETAAKRKAEEEERKQREILEESEKRRNQHAEGAYQEEEDGEWEYVEDGPAEIIWQGNEIIVKKKRIKVSKKSAERKIDEEDADRPTSNPLPPQSLAFASYNSSKRIDAQELLEDVPQQVPNFGTEQDKAHCPFHLKTGACRFGTRCSRAHFYPDKSSTLLIKNMYNGPGLAWEQDEGLELLAVFREWTLRQYPDEEIQRSFEEFYEDVHTEFLKFGELINFKVCKNGSYHLRGNVYVHYKSMESAILAYNTMNGRYFAGKPVIFVITCEFVGVTRWKVAICGEYMKSRLRTCSRGTACNFIHCFRNPGGDYEWADWDNPPPKFWIRKMAVLFGHSDEYGYNKQMEEEDIERSRDSSKKRTSVRSRHHSSRSQDDTMYLRDSGSGIEKTDRKWDRHSRRSVEREYSRRRRKSPDNMMEVNDSGFERKESRKRRDRRSSHSVRVHSSRTRENSEQSERNHKCDSHNYNTKYCPLAHESSDERSKESEFIKGHRKYDEKPRTNEELSSSPKGNMFSDEKDKSERKPNKRYRGESDQLVNDTDDNGGQTGSLFSVEYIDAQHLYDDRYCTNQTNEEIGKYESKYRSTHRRYKTERKGKSTKQEVNYDRNSSEEPCDRWESTNRTSDLDESLANESDNSPRKESKSRGKINYHREKRKRKVHTSCSDEELDRSAHKKYSRSRTPAWSSASSEEKRFQQSGHNS